MHRFWLSAILSYRALFAWLNPVGYVASRFLAPVSTSLIFATLARHTGNSVERPVIGGALLAVCMAAMFGVTLAVANERFYGTLGAWLSAPQGLVSSVLGKATVHVADGMLSASVTFLTTALVSHLTVAPSRIPILLLAAITAALSGTGMGVLISCLAVVFRDTFTAANVAQAIFVAVSGIFLPTAALPGVVAASSAVLPLHHAITAALSPRLDLTALALECAVAVLWAVIGFTLFLRATRHSRRTGSWDLW